MPLAKILLSGDKHLSSKNYGAHRSYPKETLHYLREVTSIIESHQVTHAIGLGDFSFGRFNTLEYRLEVEKLLDKQNELTNGNVYELKGNHDIASYGLTEYEYYVKKGTLKPSTHLQIGNLNLSMVDFGKHEKIDILPVEESKINVVAAHDYFKFSDTLMPNYGDATDLDNFSKWFGIDFLVCGHIHGHHAFKGNIRKDEEAHEVYVSFLNCLSRPAYREGNMDSVGKLIMFTVEDSGNVLVEYIDIPLWDITMSFNLDKREEIITNKEMKRINVSDIVSNLNQFSRTIGSPEDIIMAMEDKDIKYRKEAIRLLAEAQG